MASRSTHPAAISARQSRCRGSRPRVASRVANFRTTNGCHHVAPRRGRRDRRGGREVREAQVVADHHANRCWLLRDCRDRRRGAQTASHENLRSRSERGRAVLRVNLVGLAMTIASGFRDRPDRMDARWCPHRAGSIRFGTVTSTARRAKRGCRRGGCRRTRTDHQHAECTDRRCRLGEVSDGRCHGLRNTASTGGPVRRLGDPRRRRGRRMHRRRHRGSSRCRGRCDGAR